MSRARALMVARLSATAALLGGGALLVFHHGSGGLKGSFVPLTNVGSCIMLSAAATVLCQTLWHKLPAPFVGGVAGVFGIGDRAGPYGGVLGLLVGLLIVLWLPGRRATDGASTLCPPQSDDSNPAKGKSGRQAACG